MIDCILTIHTNIEWEYMCYIDVKLQYLLKNQLKVYDRADPPVKYQAALPKWTYWNI